MPDHAEVHRAANRSSRRRHLRIWPQRDRQALTKKFHLQRQASNRIKVTFDSFTRGVASPRVGSGSRICAGPQRIRCKPFVSSAER